MALIVAAALAAAGLVAPASAAAKEITRVRVCGPVACADVPGGAPARSDAAMGGLDWPRPVRPAPFYVVRYTVGLAPGEGGPARTGWSVRWLPSADRMRVRGEGGRPEWLTVLAETRRALERAAGGVEPFPRSAWRGPARPAPAPPAGAVRAAAQPAGPADAARAPSQPAGPADAARAAAQPAGPAGPAGAPAPPAGSPSPSPSPWTPVLAWRTWLLAAPAAT